MPQDFNRRPQGGNYQGNRGRDASDERANIDLSRIILGKDKSVELFSEIAQATAKHIAEESRSGVNKSTQLRKFYDELVMWSDKVSLEKGNEARKKKYEELAPYIKMMCAKVTYARGRNHVSEGFEKLFTKLIKSANEPETLRDAKLFMEAFMGFYKAEEK